MAWCQTAVAASFARSASIPRVEPDTRQGRSPLTAARERSLPWQRALASSSEEETARAVAELLVDSDLSASPGSPVYHRFVVSDDEPRFRQVGSRFIGETLASAEVVALG